MDEKTLQQEELEAERLAALHQNRKKARSNEGGVNPLSLAGETAATAGIGGFLMLGVAIVADLLDWAIVGSIPILGDIIDVFMGLTLWFWVKTKGLDTGKPWWVSWGPGIATGVEVIPFIGDIPPSYAIYVIIILVMNTEQGRKIMKTVSPIKKVSPV